MFHLYRAAILLSIGACAPLKAHSGEPTHQDEGTSVFEGWVSFSEGLHLWRNRSELRHFSRGACVSGALPRSVFDMARTRYEGRRVRIRGHLSDEPPMSSDIGVQQIRNYQGTRFANQCGGPQIILG